MGGVVGMLTGSASKKSAKAAETAQALSRQQQGVANARQLSTAAEETARTGLVRRNAKGRRLLADAKASDLPSVVA
jgi:hypothetical protein